MKKRREKTLALSMAFTAIVSLGVLGCQNELKDPAHELFKENSTTVEWKGSRDEISSFSANVTVYSMDTRKETSLKQDSSYRLATKIIDGEQYTRMDMKDAGPDGRLRSVVSGPTEMLVFDTATEEIQYRVPVATAANDFAFLQNDLGFGKVDLRNVRAEAKRLSLDMAEDGESGLLISLPNEGFSTEDEKRISTKVRYDTTAEVLTNMETVDIRGDGSTVTSSIEFVYQDCGDGNYVKVGMITKIDTQYEEKIEGFPEDMPRYETMDDIPEISEEDFKKMEEAGNVFENPSIKLGDPADPSYAVTVVEVYDDVSVNDADSSAFRLLF